MAKTIIAGMAVLLLSAGVAVAQSSNQNSVSSGTSASAGMRSDKPAETGAAQATTKTKMRVTAHYPKAEARLNAQEAQTTKQLNIQESQEVASNSAGASGSMSASGSSGAGGGTPQ
jgi:hypothetical protein